MLTMPNNYANSDSDTELDSEEELRDAYKKGLLKPGLNRVIEKSIRKYVNNVDDMELKLKELKSNLPWIETLDIITQPAPMAPDVALHLRDTELRRKNIAENNKAKDTYNAADDPVLNEFKRENMIHRQAQAAVLEGVERLKSLGVYTRRPDDYFAEMAKSDEHMDKVRKNLLAKQAGQARAEKVRQLRQHKKISKQLQIEAKQKQQAAKKETLLQLQRVRKGHSNDLSFLDDNADKKKKNQKNKVDVSKKRAAKNEKFGYGGKKKGTKGNTRESTNQFGDYNRSGKSKKAFGSGKGKPAKAQRPGKARRKNAKR